MDVVKLLGRNVTAMWPTRFSGVRSLALAAGMSTSQLYVILDGGCDPSIDRLGELASALACAPSELIRPRTQQIPESWTRIAPIEPP